jgi:3-deoxy-D-manno-oct-2-ulosonic acid (Kdo) hydroxylase
VSFTPILSLQASQWTIPGEHNDWIEALEDGQVLHFANLPFLVQDAEQKLFTPEIQNPKSRNISVGADGVLKGAIGDEQTLETLRQFILRYRQVCQELVHSIVPKYMDDLKISPTSFRPFNIEHRKQSWRADDRRLHVDAFATRPNYGERILRVFMNINPHHQSRVWRVGDSFENIVDQFLPKLKPYSATQAKFLNYVGLTKSYRSEYDHLMLQLHDAMKRDLDYQEQSPQVRFEFKPKDVWVCFSDQTSHAAMSGQFMLEQTYHLPVGALYNPQKSPLGILQEKLQKSLI